MTDIEINAEKKLNTASFFALLSIFSFLFLLIFSYSTSPITNCDNGSDSAFFRLVGQGMTKGYLPYRDFFDMKGPVLFFIEYAGQLIAYGRLGIFIIQWFNLILTLAIITRTYDLYGIRNRFLQLGLMTPFAYIASFTFEGGNLTEEFSLLPLFSCLYVCLRFFMNSEHNSKKWQRDVYWLAGAWFGICFGILAMIRLSNTALICAMMVSVALYLLIHHKIKQLLLCTVSFCLGLIIVATPAILFFYSKGLLYEMLENMFILGFKYAGEKSFLSHLSETIHHRWNQRLLLLAVPACIPMMLSWRSLRERVLSLFGALLTYLAIASGNNYGHYYTLVLPLLIICELALVESLSARKKKLRATVAVLLAVVMLVPQYSILDECIQHIFYPRIFDQSSFNTEQLVLDIVSYIPEEDSASVYCYNLEPSWYTYAGLFPCIKYCGWQNHYISIMPQIYDRLKKSFEEVLPNWLVLPVEIGTIPDFLEASITSDYQRIYENDSYILLSRQ